MSEQRAAERALANYSAFLNELFPSALENMSAAEEPSTGLSTDSVFLERIEDTAKEASVLAFPNDTLDVEPAAIDPLKTGFEGLQGHSSASTVEDTQESEESEYPKWSLEAILWSSTYCWH